MSANGNNEFPPTKWSTVLATRQTDPKAALAAMEELCRNYRTPLYGFARRKGLSPEDAEDLVQSFFEGKVIEARMFEAAKPEMGRLSTGERK
jgi:RNA polymerase sigma-70 factor (ECF subfamily)